MGQSYEQLSLEDRFEIAMHWKDGGFEPAN